MDEVDDSFRDSAENDEEEEPMTPMEALAALELAWLNEKHSPELLKHKSELVDCMLEQIRHMEDNIKHLQKGNFLISVHKMEIDRVNYIIRSYLKCRLGKIEKYTAHILDVESKTTADKKCLSPAEHIYAQEHLKSVEDHLKRLALQHMPTNVQTFESKKTMPTPNLGSYVFLKMNENVLGLEIVDDVIEGGEEVVDLELGTQHLMQYKPISHLIKSGQASLI